MNQPQRVIVVFKAENRVLTRTSSLESLRFVFVFNEMVLVLVVDPPVSLSRSSTGCA